ncbi:MAG TPA: FtsX-like permease family protein [Candidatus Sulfopaludibacter sp.]|jgi:putative ABC transport system permease protein|nr:FtsX-like permease family protein [Candidatus Sulfopaludibacter sp.]
MDFKEVVFLTLSSIKERKTRNILTIVMITMGCGLLVSLNSLTQGLIDYVEQNFKKILPNQIIISNSDKIQQSNLQNIQNKLEVLFDKNLTVVEKRIPFDSNTIKYLQNISGVDFVDPAYQGMILLKHGNKSDITNVIAANFTNLKNIIPDFNNNQILNKSSMTSNKKIIILPQKISESLSLSDNNRVNTNVTVQNIKDSTNPSTSSSTSKDNNNFDVIAIINSTGNPVIDNSAFIETKEGKEILNKSSDYDILFLTYNDINKVDNIVKTIQKHFNNQVSILNSLEILKTLTKFIVGISTFISSIAAFSLIVGSLGIIITIYTSVVERTQEIGILKTLGGTNKTILGLFLTESVIIGIIGAIIGILFGFLGSYVLLNAFLFFLKLPIKIYPIFNLVEILKIFIVVIGLSIFSGLYPAYKGSKVSPVNALNKFF